LAGNRKTPGNLSRPQNRLVPKFLRQYPKIMRIVTWNIRKNPDAVAFAFDSLGADVLLAQECHTRELSGLSVVGANIEERWVKHKWGNYTFSKMLLARVEFPTDYKGSLTVTTVQTATGLLGLINIYGLFERIGPGETKKLVTPGIHRKLSDLSPLLWRKAPGAIDRFVIGGDFNHDRRMDTHPSFKKLKATPFSGLFARVEDFGMTDLLHAQFPEGIQTFRAVRGEYPWQLDHVFVSNKLASTCDISVHDSSEVHKMSDHNPVILDL